MAKTTKTTKASPKGTATPKTKSSTTGGILPDAEKLPKAPSGKPARGPGIMEAENVGKSKLKNEKLPSGEPKPTLAKNDGPPETLEEEVAAGNKAPAADAQLKKQQADALVKVNADIAAKQEAMIDRPTPGLPYVENDPVNAKAVSDAQEGADRMFAKGVAEAELEEMPFIEPSEEEIRAEVLSRVAAERHDHDRQLDAYVALDPNFEPGRNNAEHAAAQARVKENNF